MSELACQVVNVLGNKTLATAESCTGGGIGSAITAVSGSSRVFKGGIISYTNEIKQKLLGVSADVLANKGAVCPEVAIQMADGVRKLLSADVAVSVTGIAGPSSDEFDTPVGLVYIGYSDQNVCICKKFCFTGERDAVRQQSIEQAFRLILERN